MYSCHCHGIIDVVQSAAASVAPSCLARITEMFKKSIVCESRLLVAELGCRVGLQVPNETAEGFLALL